MRKRENNFIMKTIITGFFVIANIHTIYAADVKLNTDTLREVKEKTYGSLEGDYWTTCGKLFSGLDANGCTLGDILENIEKYGINYEMSATEDTEGVLMYNLYFGTGAWTTPADLPAIPERADFLWNHWYGSPELSNLSEQEHERMLQDYYQTDEWIQYVNAYKQKQREVRIYPNTGCEVTFYNIVYNNGEKRDDILEIHTNSYFDNTDIKQVSLADTEALIEKIDYINNGLSLGVLDNGWKQENVNGGVCWVYFENGIRSTGWKEIDGYWYYFKPDFSMTHSCFEIIDGKIYHFSKDGWMDKGWQFINKNGIDSWYYFDSDGKMITGWKDIDGHKYYFQSDGTLTHSKIELIDGKKYFFNTDGWMLSNCIMNLDGVNYKIDADGIVSPATDKFVEKIGAVIASYPANSYWSGEGECHGFARELQKRIFGTDAYIDMCASGCVESHGSHQGNNAKTTDIKEGDVVRVYGHSFFVTNIEHRNDGTYLKTREVWGSSGNIIKDNEWKIVSETELLGAPNIWGQTLKLQYIRRIPNRDSHELFKVY